MLKIKIGEILSLDIVKYSVLSSEQQLILLNEINRLVLLNIKNKNLASLGLKYIPNGDGFHIISNNGMSLVIALILKKIETVIHSKLPFFSGYRISVINGEYFGFVDILGNFNYIGSGIINAELVTSDKSLFFGGNIVIEGDIFKSCPYSLNIKYSKPFLYSKCNINKELLNIWV